MNKNFILHFRRDTLFLDSAGRAGRNPVPNGEFLRTKQGVSGRVARIERPGKNITTPVEKRYRGRGKINTRSCKTLPLHCEGM